MDFEMVKIGDNRHANVNGVTSAPFARQTTDGDWAIMIPRIAYSVETAQEAVRRIAEAMGNWYTATEAAARLVEMGVFDEPPSAQRVTKWCRDGLLPGAFKLLGRGARGSGGSWRIPEAALRMFAERRKGQ